MTFALPSGKSLEEVLAAIEHVCLMLASSFTFGYFDVDDIKQQARIYAMEALPKYDGERDLANFLFIHVRNRLLNLQRDKLRRNDPPCLSCHEGRPCSRSDDGLSGSPVVCRRYGEWFRRNAAKAGLMQPSGWTDALASQHTDRSQKSASEQVARQELLQRLDTDLPASLRSDYMRMKEGASLPRARREAVLRAAREVLGIDLEGESDD